MKIVVIQISSNKHARIVAMEGEQPQNAHEDGNAFGPSRELTTAQEWQDWLSSNLPDFKGNYENAGLLMASLTIGRNYVIDKLSSRGLKGFEKPKVVILTQDSATSSPIGSALGGHVQFVKRSFIEEYSQLDMSAKASVTRTDGEIAFIGTVPDMFRLAGVEETHHGIFEQINKDIPPGVDPLSSSMAEYDAREVEYRALRWQIRYAQEHNLPQHTIDKLKERLASAKQVRIDLKNAQVKIASEREHSHEGN